MTAIATAQISHESETQRQHVRLAIPAKVIFNGKEYAVRNISAGGIAISGVLDILTRGKQVALDLNLPFDSFEMTIGVDAEVIHTSAKDKIVGCRFVNLKPEQISFLNYVMKSYISGEIVTSGNILNIAARNNFTKVRTHANINAAPTLKRQLPGLMLVTVIGFLIMAFIAGNLYNSIFILRSEDATVAAPVISVRSDTEGIYRSRIDPGLKLVQKNQTIGTITPVSGNPVNIQSPCNCYISGTQLDTGEPVAKGQQLISLVPIDSKPWIIAELNSIQSKKISPEADVSVSVFGSRLPYTGKVISMESALSDPRRAGSKSVLMKIALDQKLPVDFVNRLATVTFAIH